MKKRKLMAMLLAASMTLGLCACGNSGNSNAGNNADKKAGAPVSSEAEKENKDSDANAVPTGDSALNVHVETEVESLDPQIATDGTSFEVIANFTDGLYQMDADGNAVPALAEDEQISEDGLTYTFKIREDANWSNGDPVTASDFVFAWQRAVNPEVASEYAFIVSDVALVKNAAAICAGGKEVSELGVTAVDEKTLKVELEAPVSFFNILMYFPTFYPVNQKFFESCGDTFATSPDTVLSNGAFKMTSYEPAATSFSLEKNADYYDADRVKLSGLNYQVIKDNQQALLSYQSGTLDLITVAGSQVEQIQNDPEFSTVDAGYLWYISPNLKEVEALNNLNMRMALNLAFEPSFTTPAPITS